jgi:hypothetical protein
MRKDIFLILRVLLIMMMETKLILVEIGDNDDSLL